MDAFVLRGVCEVALALVAPCRSFSVLCALPAPVSPPRRHARRPRLVRRARRALRPRRRTPWRRCPRRALCPPAGQARRDPRPVVLPERHLRHGHHPVPVDLQRRPRGPHCLLEPLQPGDHRGVRLLVRHSRRPACLRVVRVDDDPLDEERDGRCQLVQLFRRPLHGGGPRSGDWHRRGWRLHQGPVAHRDPCRRIGHPRACRSLGLGVGVDHRPLDLQPRRRPHLDRERPRAHRERVYRLVRTVRRLVAGSSFAERRGPGQDLRRRSPRRSGVCGCRRRRRWRRGSRVIGRPVNSPSAGSAFLRGVPLAAAASTAVQAAAQPLPTHLFPCSCPSLSPT